MLEMAGNAAGTLRVSCRSSPLPPVARLALLSTGVAAEGGACEAQALRASCRGLMSEAAAPAEGTADAAGRGLPRPGLQVAAGQARP